MNPYYAIIEDSLIEALERDSGIWLPEEFEVTVPDEEFKAFVAAGLAYPDKAPVPLTAKHITVKIQGYMVLVRSEADPDNWLPVLRSEALH